MNAESTLTSLAGLMRRRLAIIADHAWRERDAAAHLDALRAVSEELMEQWARVREGQHPRLKHFMERCSYDKALALIEGRGGDAAETHE